MNTSPTSENPPVTLPPLARRQFLATAASATAFTVLSPAVVFGAEANTRVTAGCVGLGGRGGWIADYVGKHAGFQVTALADYFPEVVEPAGQRLKVPKERCFSGLDGYQRLLASKVEAVFLETPPYFFPSHAVAAVAAGCHVYVAKPVAVDVPGALTIREQGKKSTLNKKVFLVDFQTRTEPFHIEAIRRVHAGVIGKIGMIGSYYYDECFTDPPRQKTVANLLRGLAWVNDTALGGAYIVNCDIHALDVALWIAGDVPQSAVGYAGRNRPNAQGDSADSYAISFQFKNGMVMTNRSDHVRNATEFDSGCQAYGQQGFIETHYGGKTFIRGLQDGYAGGECKKLYEEGMNRNVDTFHKSIGGGIYDNPTVEPSVNSTLVSILGREAAASGRKITWDELLASTTRLEVDLSGLKV